MPAAPANGGGAHYSTTPPLPPFLVDGGKTFRSVKPLPLRVRVSSAPESLPSPRMRVWEGCLERRLKEMPLWALALSLLSDSAAPSWPCAEKPVMFRGGAAPKGAVRSRPGSRDASCSTGVGCTSLCPELRVVCVVRPPAQGPAPGLGPGPEPGPGPMPPAPPARLLGGLLGASLSRVPLRLPRLRICAGVSACEPDPGGSWPRLERLSARVGVASSSRREASPPDASDAPSSAAPSAAPSPMSDDASS
mmetsp:Transcript_4587/g.13437  ORF Transcript_4587/g.13437 Transcript_4587/m.13437 type:complete len:249 (-) Transcript_4587:1108-1854(-)